MQITIGLQQLAGDARSCAREAGNDCTQGAFMNYRALRPASDRIRNQCRLFLYILLAQRVELAALEGIDVEDPNYVQTWLDVHKIKLHSPYQVRRQISWHPMFHMCTPDLAGSVCITSLLHSCVK